jgi:hypothetical protein
MIMSSKVAIVSHVTINYDNTNDYDETDVHWAEKGNRLYFTETTSSKVVFALYWEID